MGTSNKPLADAWAIYERAGRDWNAALDAGRPTRDVLERLYAAVILVMRTYCRPANFHDDGTPKEHLPIQFVRLIANQIDHIKQGNLPRMISNMVRPGAPGVGPHERRDKGLAVAYIRAARGGLIRDRHPVKTVTRFYGVTDRAVRRWQNEFPDVSPADFFWDVDGSELGELVEYAMKTAGLRYKKAGRGSQGRSEYPRPKKRPKAEQTQ